MIRQPPVCQPPPPQQLRSPFAIDGFFVYIEHQPRQSTVKAVQSGACHAHHMSALFICVVHTHFHCNHSAAISVCMFFFHAVEYCSTTVSTTDACTAYRKQTAPHRPHPHSRFFFIAGSSPRELSCIATYALHFHCNPKVAISVCRLHHYTQAFHGVRKLYHIRISSRIFSI